MVEEKLGLHIYTRIYGPMAQVFIQPCGGVEEHASSLLWASIAWTYSWRSYSLLALL
jgi:hypothetical protein